MLCVVYLKEFLGCAVKPFKDYFSYGRMLNIMRFHTGSSQSPQTLLPSLQLEVRTSIYATLIDLDDKYGGTIILDL